jgi:tRNA (mo5U34)-methyltransferase
MNLGGVQTAPNHFLGDYPACKWNTFSHSIPADLSGKSVLDIGCNAGFYTFEIAKRGALVTAIDINAMYLDQARWGAREFGLEHRVRFEQCHIYEFARRSEWYDLVLFMGVFYHLRHPLLGLDIAARKVRRLMVFQTLTTQGDDTVATAAQDVDFQRLERLDDPGWPKMAFIETTFCRDPTNWWFPNHSAVLAMLRSAGLLLTERPASDMYLCEPDAGSVRADWEIDEYRAATGQ